MIDDQDETPEETPLGAPEETQTALAKHVPAELHGVLALINDLAEDASLDELEGIAEANGADFAAMLGLLQTPAGQRLANAARAKAVQSGELIQTKARRALNFGIDRIQQALRDDSASAGTVAKLVEILNRVSGLAEERAARLRPGSESGNFMSLVIRGPNDPEPPPTAPGELRLTIVAPGAPTEKTVHESGHRVQRHCRPAIEAEVVDD